MIQSYKITERERTVLKVMWEKPGPILTSELVIRINEKGINWTRQNVNVILCRLQQKKFVIRNQAYVETLLSEQDFLKKQTQEILDSFYGGKLTNFCAALIGKAKADEEYRTRLCSLIEERKGK